MPTANKAKYIEYARGYSAIFREHGATKVTENWGDNIPDGKLTDFRRAVQAKPDETIVFSWVTWPDKKTRDAGWEKMMQDERMMKMEMPFDGKRMIYGGFEQVFEG